MMTPLKYECWRVFRPSACVNVLGLVGRQASSTTPQDAPRGGERIPAGHGMALSHEALSNHLFSNEHRLSPIVSQIFFARHLYRLFKPPQRALRAKLMTQLSLRAIMASIHGRLALRAVDVAPYYSYHRAIAPSAFGEPMKPAITHALSPAKAALVALGAGSAAILFAGLFLAWRVSDAAAVQRLIDAEAAKHGLSVAVQSIEPRFTPLPSLSLTGVSISATALVGRPASSPELVRVDAITLRPALLPLLAGRFELKSGQMGSALLFFNQPGQLDAWRGLLKPATPASSSGPSSSTSQAEGTFSAQRVEARLPSADSNPRIAFFSDASLSWTPAEILLRGSVLDNEDVLTPIQLVAESGERGWGLRASAAGSDWQARLVIEPSAPQHWASSMSGSLFIQAADSSGLSRSWLSGAPLSGSLNVAAPFSFSNSQATISPIDANAGPWRAKGGVSIDFRPAKPMAVAQLSLSRVAEASKPAVPKEQASDKDGLSNRPLPWALLASLDADVLLAADKLSWDGFSASGAKASLSIRDGLLSGPFFANIPSGSISGSAKADSRSRRAEIAFSAQGQAQALLEANGIKGAVSGGSFVVDANFAAQGDSPAALLAGASGPMVVDMDRVGIVSSKAAAVSKILGALIPALGGSDGSVVFECAAAKWSFVGGKAQGAPLAAAESPYFALLSSGTINAGDQSLNIAFEARPKGALAVGNLGSLASAARVQGHWSDPSIKIDGLAATRGLGQIASAIAAGSSAALGQVLSPPPPAANVCGSLLGRPMAVVAPPAVHVPEPFQKSVDTFRQIFKR